MTPIKPGDRVYRVVTSFDGIRPTFAVEERTVTLVLDGSCEFRVAMPFGDGERHFGYEEIGDTVFRTAVGAIDAFRAGMDETRRRAEQERAVADAALAWARSVA